MSDSAVPVRHPTGFLVGALVVGVAAVALISAFWVYGFIQLGYTAGWAGTPGTLSHVTSDVTGDDGGDGGTTTTYYADFTPAAPGPVLRTLDIGHRNPGDAATYPARLHSDGLHASVVSTRQVLNNVGLLLFPLVPVEAIVGIPYLARRRRRRTGPQDVPRGPLRIVLPPLITALLLLVVAIVLSAS
jgi:hypothetical protein